MIKPSLSDIIKAQDAAASKLSLKEPAPFRYSDAEWTIIANELPAGGDVDQIRIDLEACCSAYRLILINDMKDYGKHRDSYWRFLADKARQLLKEWPTELTFTWETKGHESIQTAEPLLLDLRRLVAQLEERATPSAPPPRKGPAPVERDILVGHLIWIWVHLGGTLGTSTSAISGMAGGKIVRFLVAAANPVLEKKMTLEAARALVRKYKQHNEPPFDESGRR